MALGVSDDGRAAPVLAGYRVEELIGFGGCGEVWRARDVLTGRLVALKKLNGDGPPAERDRLRREAAVLAGLSSPHIVRLITVVTSVSGMVLVLEFQGGGSLASLLQVRSRLAPGEVVTIAAPLAAALAEVHSGGLLHGDLSPANVLFATDGRPVLSDLGVARLLGRAGSDAVTPMYADPAVLAGAPLTAATDVYALGAICHQALAGRPPYAGTDAETVISAAEQGRLSLTDLAPGLPPLLVAAVEAALSPDAESRPDAAAFGEALLAACPPSPVRLAGASVPVQTAPTAAVRRLPPLAAEPDPEPSRAERLGSYLSSIPLSPRRLVLTAAVPVAIGVAIWGGVAWARSTSNPGATSLALSAPATTIRPVPVRPSLAAAPGRPRPAPSAPLPSQEHAAPAKAPATIAPPASLGFRQVLERLDRLRDAAFVAADAGALSRVYADGSLPLLGDLQRMATMVSAGQHARGLALRLHAVTVLSGSRTAVRLRVSDELSPYALVATDGRVRARIPGRPLTSWSIRLVHTGGGADGWRIASIAPA